MSKIEKELKKDIKSFKNKIKEIKKNRKAKMEELNIEKDSKIAKKLKNKSIKEIKSLKRKIRKSNDKLLSLLDNKITYIYQFQLQKNKKVRLWSLESINTSEFILLKRYKISKDDIKFFTKLLYSLVNEKEFNIFINDVEYFGSIKKLIKEYDFNKKYEFIAE